MMNNANIPSELPLPPHFDPQKVDQIWRVPYEERAKEARDWANVHSLQPHELDEFKIALVLIDIQNTFCIPGFELYVGGRSGTGAVDDNRRLVQFIYRNLGAITHISLTLDTHQATQIFHPIFLVDENGENPAPYTLVTEDEIREGRWKFNSILAEDLDTNAAYGQSQLEHYVSQLASKEKYDLTIWPYHAMLGGIGHALVPSVEEAVFFHTISRFSQPDFEIKGSNPFTEHYSAIGPEVLRGAQGESLGERSDRIIQVVQKYDAVLFAGQAKSHCVAWTISDLLDQILERNPEMAGKVYLLDDCTSPVVVPDVIDYTDQAEQEFSRFSDSGMHIVHSSDPMDSWPAMAS